MEASIWVTSDHTNEIRLKLLSYGRSLEKKAQNSFFIQTPLFDDIHFAPGLMNRALGEFNANYRVIILNEELITEEISIRTIENIFIHEMAHALDYALNNSISGHSKQFREYCVFFNIDPGFEKAKIKAEIKKRDRRENLIEKLLALSSSPFENEAMIALAMARKLMVENSFTKAQNEEKIYITTLFESSRISYGALAIANFVAKATGVYIVKVKNNALFKLNAYGSLEEVEAALYLVNFLNGAIDQKIRMLRREGSGITKNNFISGMLAELERKLNLYGNETSAAIKSVKKTNEELVKKLIFPTNLRTVRKKTSIKSLYSFKKGAEFGKNTDIPKKIEQKKIQL